MDQSLKQKKAEALKSLQAGKMDIEGLNERLRIVPMNFCEHLLKFMAWVSDSYPSEAEPAGDDIISSSGNLEAMLPRTVFLIEQYSFAGSGFYQFLEEGNV